MGRGISSPRKRLGVGLTYSSAIEPLLSESGLVDVLEVEPEGLLVRGNTHEPYQVDEESLHRLARLPQPRIVHGVGFPVGGSQKPDPAHTKIFARMCDGLGAAWASEHLNFNRAAGRGHPFLAGFLLPPRQTPEGVKACAESIRSVKDRLRIPFAFETGVNYLQPRSDELDDGAFVAAVAEKADCGILLDLHNIWTNQRNGRQDIERFLDRIPLDRVWEIHLAGGEETDGYWLDAHCGEVPDEVMRLAEDVLPRCPNVSALIFEIFPAYVPRVGIPKLRRQLRRMKRIWNRSKFSPHPARPARKRQNVTRPLVPIGMNVRPPEWERALAALVKGSMRHDELSRKLLEDPGISVYRKLVATFRASAIVGTMPMTARLLRERLGPRGLERLLHSFWSARPPSLFPSDEAIAFRTHLQKHPPRAPWVLSIAEFEVAVVRTLLDGRTRRVSFDVDPATLLSRLAKQGGTGRMARGKFEMTINLDEAARWAGVRARTPDTHH